MVRKFSRLVRKVPDACRLHRDDEMDDQHRGPAQELRGHDAHSSITVNVCARPSRSGSPFTKRGVVALAYGRGSHLERVMQG